MDTIDVMDLKQRHELRWAAETEFRQTESALLENLSQKLGLSSIEHACGQALAEPDDGPRGLRPPRKNTVVMAHWRLRRGDGCMEWREAIAPPADGTVLPTYALEFGAFGVGGTEPANNEDEMVLTSTWSKSSRTPLEAATWWRIWCSDIRPGSMRALSLYGLIRALAKASVGPRLARELEAAFTAMQDERTNTWLLSASQAPVVARLMADTFAERYRD